MMDKAVRALVVIVAAVIALGTGCRETVDSQVKLIDEQGR